MNPLVRISFMLTLGSTSAAFAQSAWYVDASAAPPGLGTVSAPYTSLQYAIDRATTVAGDTLVVAAGTYLETIDLHGKALIIDGSAAPSRPVIDGNGLGVAVRIASGEGPGTRLVGLVVRGGDARVAPAPKRGGGVWVDGAQPSFEGVTFVDNLAESGGGVAVRNSAVTFTDCAWTGNRANTGGGLHIESSSVSMLAGEVTLNRASPLTSSGAGQGGGVLAAAGATLTIQGTLFRENEVRGFFGSGGALAALSTAGATTVDDATFVRNSPGTFLEPGFGGAIRAAGPLVARNCTFTSNGTPVEFDNTVQGGAALGGDYFDCLFEANGAQLGGALYQGSATRCTFVKNEAFADGSGEGGAAHSAALVDCVVRDNRAFGNGGGMCRGSATGCELLFNRTEGSAGNSLPGYGGGAYGATLTDTLVHGNEALAAFGIGVPSAGGGAYNCTLAGCVVTSNRAELGGGVAASSATGSSADRVTIVGNFASLAGGGVSNGDYRNTIVWHNFGGAAFGAFTFAYSNVEVPATGLGNLSLDPLVFGRSGGDVHLRAGSPCIDAGDPNAPLDLNGTRVDIGALTFDPGWLEGPANYCRPTRTPAPEECLPEIEALGVASLSSPTPLTLMGTSIVPGQLGILLMGHTPASVALSYPGLDPITICVGPAFVRGPVQQATMGGPCGGVLNLQLNAAYFASVGFAPGDRLHAQYWFRRPNGTALTDAVDVPVVP
ncbi:MAG: hypothetical protein R3F49_24795 [Planctomycetota bacterium]